MTTTTLSSTIATSILERTAGPDEVRALAHIPTRDRVLVRLCRQDQWRETLRGLLRTSARCLDLDPAEAAPLFTLYAIAAWACGRDALAGTVITAALQYDPDYNLAHLVRDALDSGLAPGSILPVWAGITDEEITAAAG